MIKKTRSNRQAGFTLIELMIVTAILAILLSIAIPAYQNYSVRAQNSECLSIAAPAKTFVAESAQAQGVMIDSGTANLAGWVPPAATDLCSSVQIADGTGVITVTTNVAGSSGQFILTPSQSDESDSVEWACTSPGMPANHAPANCRDT